MDFSLTPVIDPDGEVDQIQEDSLNELLNTAVQEAVMANERIENISERIFVLEGIKADFDKGRITKDQVSYVNLVVESASNITKREKIDILAAEHIGSRIAEAIGTLFKDLKISLQKYAESVHYFYTLFNLQSSRLRKVESRLSSVRNGKVNIRLGVNKYLLFGEGHRVVSTGDEYVKEFKKTMDVLESFVLSVADLTEDDLFSSIKMIGNYIFSDPEEFFLERFNSLERTLTNAAKGIDGRAEKGFGQYIEYISPVLLGLGKVGVRYPKKSTYGRENYLDAVNASRHFHMYLERESKVHFSTLFSGNTQLEFSKNDIQAMVSQIKRVIHSADRLLSLSNKISEQGAWLSVVGSPSAEREGDSSTDVFSATRSGRIVSRISLILVECTAASYNFTLGNIKQALTISEKAIEKLS